MVCERGLLMRNYDIVNQHKALRRPSLDPLFGVSFSAMTLGALPRIMLIKKDKMTFVNSHDDREVGALGLNLDSELKYCIGNAREVKS